MAERKDRAEAFALRTVSGAGVRTQVGISGTASWNAVEWTAPPPLSSDSDANVTPNGRSASLLCCDVAKLPSIKN